MEDNMKGKFNKGFTLIEIIIVIVIIGVLATLALPRITGQIEAARGAEAMNYFGAIRRAVTNCVDMGNASGDIPGANAAAANCLTYGQIGMTAPAAGTALFTYYSANAGGTMQFKALRSIAGGYAICMNFTAGTAQAQYSAGPGVAPAVNPYAAAVTRTGTMGGAACTNAPGTAM